MKNILKYLFLLIAAFSISSCEEIIEVDLNSAEPQLVIEANVTDTTGPYLVMISKTVGFSHVNNFQGVEGAFVTLADDNGLYDTLSEISSGLYTTHTLRGKLNSSFSLFALVEGKQYTSVSGMPAKVKLDSLYTTTNGGGGFGNGNRTFVVPKYRDEAGMRNFYRFILYINGIQTDDIFVQNDLKRDGQVVNQPLRSRTDIHAGDLLTVEMQCIDEKVYNYFYSMSLNFRKGLNQTQTPSNPPTNITGGNLGYFNAHTTQRKSVTAP